VHDEVVVNSHESCAQEVKQIMQDKMENTTRLSRTFECRTTNWKKIFGVKVIHYIIILILLLLISCAPVKSPEQPTYITDIKPIIILYCVECHSYGSKNGNWLDYKTLKSKSAALKQRIWVKRDMPMGYDMPELKRQTIKTWIGPGLQGVVMLETFVLSMCMYTTSEACLTAASAYYQASGTEQIITAREKDFTAEKPCYICSYSLYRSNISKNYNC
jgi:hypothetical protein